MVCSVLHGYEMYLYNATYFFLLEGREKEGKGDPGQKRAFII